MVSRRCAAVSRPRKQKSRALGATNASQAFAVVLMYWFAISLVFFLTATASATWKWPGTAKAGTGCQTTSTSWKTGSRPINATL